MFDTFGKGDTPQEEKKELSLFLSLSNAHAARGKYFHWDSQYTREVERERERERKEREREYGPGIVRYWRW